MITVIISDASKNFINKTEKYLSKDSEISVVKGAETLDELENIARDHDSPVIVIGPAYEAEASIGFAESFSINNPTLGVVWVVNEISSDLMVRGLKSGFKDIITDADLEKLPTIVRRLSEQDKRVRKAILGLKDTHVDEAHDIEPNNKDGRIITFFSTKGGVGKTFIASNVAVGLAAETKKRVVLVDLDLRFGDVGVMLKLTPDRTLYDLLPVLDRLDENMIKGFLTSHSSGATVLLAPVQPDAADKINPDHLKKIFSVLRKVADYVIIDTPPSLNDKILTALDISDAIYLVATMDVPCVKNIKVCLQTMKLLRYDDDKIKLLLNRSDSRVSLKPSEIEKTLEKKIAAFIPSDRLAPQSVNEGDPVILSQPRSNIARGLNELVSLVKETQKLVKPEFTLRDKENVN